MAGKKTRVLWLNHRDIMHSRAGGAERSIAEISSRLARSGFQVSLYTVNDGILKEHELLHGSNVHRAPSNMIAHALVFKEIKDTNPDVIIDDMAHAVPWSSSIFSKKPVIVFFRHLHARTINGQLPLPQASIIKLLESMYTFIYPNSVFVTESESSAFDLERIGIPRNRIRVIPPGVDHSLFRPMPKTKYPSIVYFSGLRDYKRPWLSLNALEQAQKINNAASLKIVGSGPTLEKVKEASAHYKNVAFTGRVKDRELSAIIAKSWINLNLSTAEGFGYSILEAASCGTPTIALDAYGVSETVQKYGFGIVIKDMHEFGTAYEEISKDIKAWSIKVRNSAKKFSWEKCAREWVSLIEREKRKGSERINKKVF